MLNEVTLIGRIGQINTSSTSGGMQVVNYSLATTKSIRDKDSGEFRDETEWHRLVSFNKLAEHVSQKLQQGDLLYVKGELRTRKWEKAGHDHYTTEIVVNDYPKKLPRYFTQQGGVDQQQSYQQPAPQQGYNPQQQKRQQQARQPQQQYHQQGQPPRHQYRQPQQNGMEMPDF